MQPFSWRSLLSRALDFLNKLFLPGVSVHYSGWVGGWLVWGISIPKEASSILNFRAPPSAKSNQRNNAMHLG